VKYQQTSRASLRRDRAYLRPGGGAAPGVRRDVHRHRAANVTDSLLSGGGRRVAASQYFTRATLVPEG